MKHCYTSEITSGTGTSTRQKIYQSGCTGETMVTISVPVLYSSFPPIVAFPSENLLYSGLSPWGKDNFIVDLSKKYGFSPPHPRVFDSDFSKMKCRKMPNYLTIDEIIVGFENERLIDPKNRSHKTTLKIGKCGN